MIADLSRYRIVNGTSYDARTPDEVVRVLEQARLNHTRLHISLGDTITGRNWLEENDVYGDIGRSTGPIRFLCSSQIVAALAVVQSSTVASSVSKQLQADRFSINIPTITTAHCRSN